MSDSPLYLMSPPRADWALRGRANFKSRAADQVDADRARREWSTLADAIVDAGGEVVVLPPGPAELTGLIYTAEAGEYFCDSSGPGFILPSMAAAHRRAEADHIDAFVSDTLGFRTLTTEARWEAQGDAIRVDADTVVHTYGVGPDRRTSPEAYREVADRLSDQHIQIAFRADPWFHGNTFLQFFRHGDDTVMLVCPKALESEEYQRLRQFVGDIPAVELTRDQSEGYDTNALQVGSTVLAPQTFSNHARDACRQLGLDVQRLHLGELFSKGGGAPVCLTNRLWGLAAGELPDSVLWSNNSDITAHTNR